MASILHRLFGRPCDKFTERGRTVFRLAYEEARRLNHHYIGTEHILLGLLAEGEGIAAKALVKLGIELDAARRSVEFSIGAGAEPSPAELNLTPRAKRAIELAVDEARRMNHHYIGTEHLLLGLIREEEGVAARVLVSLGISLERARTEVTRLLDQPRPRDAAQDIIDKLMLGPQATKRYSLALPEGLYGEVEELAERQGTTVVEVLRRFIRLGLLVTQTLDHPGGEVILREGETDRHLLLL